MGKIFFIGLSLQILLFAIVILCNKLDNKLTHLFILFVLSSIVITNIFAFNTDAEDMYIALRYVRNFLEGNGLVFNTFDRVEGYSDFLWIILIAGVHKVIHTDLPVTARCIGLIISVLVLLYTYHLSFKITKNKLLSYLAAFIVSISGSFACYGLSGLENPLFSLFILIIMNYTYEKKWLLAGLFIGLITMTRPEGLLMYFPTAIYVLLQKNTPKEKLKICFLTGIISATIILPWTIWRVSYYGYLIPNTIAAKMGMDLFYQIKIGIKYSAGFFIISESIIMLFLLPIVNFFYNKQKTSAAVSDKVLTIFFITAAIFVTFYTYAGGDWMPAWRFYSTMIPLFSVTMAVIWHNYIFKIEKNSVLKSVWIVLIFAFCGFVQVINSFKHSNMIPEARYWYYQVEGLKVIGKWFHQTLPAKTLVATFPNGAFSYFNELPTLDYGGLTDNNVGRFGNKKKTGGNPGHISENTKYILSKNPDIIAIMDGAGFVNYIESSQKFPGYETATFYFSNYANPQGEYVNLNIRSDRKEEIVNYLLQDINVKLMKPISP